LKGRDRWRSEHWRSFGNWSDGGRYPDWQREWHRGWRQKRRFIFFRFAAVFGFMVLLILGGLAIAVLLLTRLFGGNGQTAALVWIAGCGLALAFPILATALAVRAFRGIATPLAGVMAAADAVAEGDLSVRVEERGPGEFRQLAHSFNRMTDELEQAELRRRNLTADVAHELRTPLHIIQGNLEGIIDGVYEPTEAHISATLDETQLLARLVDDLRTLSLAESGQLELVLEAVDISELLADIRTSFSGQAEAAGVALEVAMPDKPGLLVLSADADRLDQVLSNLVANALRYTPAGGTISLKAERSTDGIRITVSDDGVGIPEEDLPYIFDRFWRGDPSRTRVGGSVGLGLAIAQQLVQAHGGSIAVDSSTDTGTTFTVDLPIDRRVV
jgi:signal transduction histidine kinase